MAASDRIPYTAHVARGVVRTALGDYLPVRLAGGSFQSNDEELNNKHDRLKIL
jgi:hypothetical protein